MKPWLLLKQPTFHIILASEASSFAKDCCYRILTGQMTCIAPSQQSLGTEGNCKTNTNAMTYRNLKLNYSKVTYHDEQITKVS